MGSFDIKDKFKCFSGSGQSEARLVQAQGLTGRDIVERAFSSRTDSTQQDTAHATSSDANNIATGTTKLNNRADGFRGLHEGRTITRCGKHNSGGKRHDTNYMGKTQDSRPNRVFDDTDTLPKHRADFSATFANVALKCTKEPLCADSTTNAGERVDRDSIHTTLDEERRSSIPHFQGSTNGNSHVADRPYQRSQLAKVHSTSRHIWSAVSRLGVYGDDYDELRTTIWTNHHGTHDNPKNSTAQVDEKDFGVKNFLDDFPLTHDSRFGVGKNPDEPRAPSKDYPLYTPKTGTIDTLWLQSQGDLTWVGARKYLDDSHWYEQVLRGTSKQQRKHFVNDHMTPYVQQLLDAGIIRRATRKSKCYVKMWCLFEGRKKRFRLIIDPETLNEAMEDVDRSYFPSLADVRKEVFSAESVLATDFSCYYYQFPLTEDVQVFYGLMIEGVEYVVCRLAMGFRGAVFVANTASRIISDAALRLVGFSTHYHIQVDNIYFYTSSERAFRLQTAFEKVCADAHCAIGSSEIFTKGTILGAEYDCKNKTVALSNRFVTKHQAFLTAFFTVRTFPVFVFWKASAVLLRVAQVLDKKLAYFYFVMKAIRRCAAQIYNEALTWTTEIQFQEDIERRQFQELFELFSQNVPRRITIIAIPITDHVFTDASDAGWGCVIITRSRIVVDEGLWNTEDRAKPIGEREAIALKFGIDIATRLALKRPLFLVDPTALAFSTSRGFSRNFMVNSAVAKANQMFPCAPIVRIPGKLNPADAPSRERALTEIEIRSAEEWIRQQVPEELGYSQTVLPPRLRCSDDSVV